MKENDMLPNYLSKYNFKRMRVKPKCVQEMTYLDQNISTFSFVLNKESSFSF